jgi:hypothetical protein
MCESNSRRTGFVSHRRLPVISDKLDPSIGESGPHDFAVRELRRSSNGQSSSTASRCQRP